MVELSQYMRMLRQAKLYMVEAEMDCEREDVPADTLKRIRDIENEIEAVKKDLEKWKE